MFSKNGISIDFRIERIGAISTIIATTTNASSNDVFALELKVAVPKFLSLSLEPASGTSIASNGGFIIQRLTITNSMQGQKPLTVKLKIDFKHGGVSVSEQAQPSLGGI